MNLYIKFYFTILAFIQIHLFLIKVMAQIRKEFAKSILEQDYIRILLISFLVLMIPNIFVYAYHTEHEFSEGFKNIQNPTTNHKGNEQLAEGIFFLGITLGYIITTMYIVFRPNNLKNYYIIILGTIAIIVIYYLSKTTGFPAPDFYDWIIIDDTTNWKDAVTKIAQQTFVIPLSMLLGIRLMNKKLKDDNSHLR